MIPKIGFGTYRVKDEQHIMNALENGYEFIDTACLYNNEKLVKNAVDKFKIKNPDKHIFISTKISKKSILEGKIEENFYERLNIFENIDLLLLHIPSKNCRKDWEELSNLYNKHRDKIKYIGVSNYDIEHLEQIKGLEIPYCNQIELNIFYNRKELINYCNIHSIPIVSHTTLARAEKFNNETLNLISNKYNVSNAKIMLTWALQQNYIVIPKTTNIDHLIENNKHDLILDETDIHLLNSLNENYIITKIIN